MSPVFCPRCGHADTFTIGFLPDTCVCRVCQSQLDWREIPGIGPDCTAAVVSDEPDDGPSDTDAGAGSPPSPAESERKQV